LYVGEMVPHPAAGFIAGFSAYSVAGVYGVMTWSGMFPDDAPLEIRNASDRRPPYEFFADLPLVTALVAAHKHDSLVGRGYESRRADYTSDLLSCRCHVFWSLPEREEEAHG
jgi:hypothetical protein